MTAPDAQRRPAGEPSGEANDQPTKAITGKRTGRLEHGWERRRLPHTKEVLYRVSWRYPQWREGQWRIRYVGYVGMLALKARAGARGAEVRVEASTVRTADMGWRQYPGPNAPRRKKVDGAT